MILLRLGDIVERLADGTCRTADGLKVFISDDIWERFSSRPCSNLQIELDTETGRWIPTPPATVYTLLSPEPKRQRKVAHSWPMFDLRLKTRGFRPRIRVRELPGFSEMEYHLRLLTMDLQRWLALSGIDCPVHPRREVRSGFRVDHPSPQLHILIPGFICCPRIAGKVTTAIAEYLEAVREGRRE